MRGLGILNCNRTCVQPSRKRVGSFGQDLERRCVADGTCAEGAQLEPKKFDPPWGKAKVGGEYHCARNVPTGSEKLKQLDESAIMQK